MQIFVSYLNQIRKTQINKTARKDAFWKIYENQLHHDNLHVENTLLFLIDLIFLERDYGPDYLFFT